jgi:hypothetical protein
MFDLICVRRQTPFDAPLPLDLGFLADALLFYQDVHLIADHDILNQLGRECGTRVLEPLIKENFLRFSYLDKRAGVRNFEVGGSRVTYQPVAMWPENGGWHLDKVAPELFSATPLNGPGVGRHFGQWFAGHVPTLDIGDDLLSGVRQDFDDATYVEVAVERILALLAPTYRLPQDYRFRVEREGDKFGVDTNVDFVKANESFNQRTGSTGDTLSPSSLLLYVLEARSDVYFAGQEGAELATAATHSAAISLKMQRIVDAAARSSGEIEAFQNMTLSNAHEIGDNLVYGYRTWSEFVDLLRKARRFKEWLRGQPTDAALTRGYLEALEKDTWYGSLPGKVLRLLAFTSLGAAVPMVLGDTGPVLPIVTSLGLGAADSLLLEKLLAGWKPNQFVNGPLKEFAKLKEP